MELAHTRRMVGAALSGELNDAPTVEDPVFGLAVPKAVEGVPSELLDPRGTWQDATAYDAQAAKLAAMFVENFKEFESGVSSEVKAAGPKV
jgi:phosphoenolpyruvate carboxykinase (ATP)